MTIHRLEEWVVIGTAIYGKVDGGAFTHVVALPNAAMPLAEGYAIRYTDAVTYVLGKPLGRV